MSAGGLVAAGLIGGGVVLLTHAISQLLGFPRSAPSPRLLVGGVDLTSTDLSSPFLVDFSVQADASLEEKYAALNRLQHAFTELHRWQPMWMYSPSVDIDVGRLILLVTPVSFASYGPTSYVGGDAATFSYVPSPPGTYASVTTVNSPTTVGVRPSFNVMTATPAAAYPPTPDPQLPLPLTALSPSRT